MAENKTQATQASVEAYLAGIEDEARRADCEALAKLMRKVTGKPAVMWGSGIVGFDSYHYRYDSGREGDMCVVGFASRKSEISVYLSCNDDDAKQAALLAKLGKHKMGKACLSIKRLADVDMRVLEQLIASSAAAVKQRYG